MEQLSGRSDVLRRPRIEFGYADRCRLERLAPESSGIMHCLNRVCTLVFKYEYYRVCLIAINISTVFSSQALPESPWPVQPEFESRMQPKHPRRVSISVIVRENDTKNTLQKKNPNSIVPTPESGESVRVSVEVEVRIGIRMRINWQLFH